MLLGYEEPLQSGWALNVGLGRCFCLPQDHPASDQLLQFSSSQVKQPLPLVMTLGVIGAIVPLPWRLFLGRKLFG